MKGQIMIYKREEYIEENDQDQKFPIKRIDVLDPIDGSAKKFVGEVVLGLQTPVGVQQIPISFEIPAATVQEAFQKFGDTAQPRIDEARKQIEDEIRKIRQEASSRIIRPGDLPMGAGGNVVDFGKLKK